MSMPYIRLYLDIRLGAEDIPESVFSSGIRGIFGRVLRKVFCVQRQLECDGCKIEKCLYRVVFDAEPQGHEQFRPYIVHHNATSKNLIRMEFTFFGKITQYLSSLYHAIFQMQEMNLKVGGNFVPLRIEAMYDDRGDVLYRRGKPEICEPALGYLHFEPVPIRNVRLHFNTPLRMKHDGKLMSEFLWQPFLRSLYHRVQYLDKYYNDDQLDLPEFWKDDGTVLAVDMEWREMYRRSFKQHQKMSLGGLVGTVALGGISSQSYGLLKLGEAIQSGKQTTFGLGRYVTADIQAI